MAYPAKRSRAAAVVEAARAVANALGVRPASLYTHVGDLVGLEGLLAETATAAMAGVLDDTDAAVAVWAFLHGYAALGAAGLCGGSGPRRGLARGVGALARGLADRMLCACPPSMSSHPRPRALGTTIGTYRMATSNRGVPAAVPRDAGERDAVVRLEDLRNVGPSIAGDLRAIGVARPRDLVGRDPYALYDALCAHTGVRHDPCVLDVFLAAVCFMDGGPALPWWHFTAERKRTLAARAAATAPAASS